MCVCYIVAMHIVYVYGSLRLCRGIGGVGFSGWGGSLCAGVVLSRDVGLIDCGIN